MGRSILLITEIFYKFFLQHNSIVLTTKIRKNKSKTQINPRLVAFVAHKQHADVSYVYQQKV